VKHADYVLLVDLVRGHWGIEALYHIRDVTFAEDASHAREPDIPARLSLRAGVPVRNVA
jgi:predicted transposase YbfD/YdcC